MSNDQQEEQRWASLADRLNPNRAAFDRELKAKWKKMPKADRSRLLKEDQEKILALKSRGTTVLPFEADNDDHCETSPTAFGHIAPLLHLLAQKLDKPASELRIYDPYYCAGGTVQHLEALGFSNVINKPEDFYKAIAEDKIPEHDIVVTNPPYSGDHFDRFVKFLNSNGKPFLLLLPSHFVKKPTYRDTLVKEDVAFVTPPERYHYWTPEGRRPDKAATDEEKTKDKGNKKMKRTGNQKRKGKQHCNLHLGARNSPFFSHWFISLAPLLPKAKLLKLYKEGGLELPKGCDLHEDEVKVEGADQTFQSKKKAAASDAAAADNEDQTKKRQRTDNESSDKDEAGEDS